MTTALDTATDVATVTVTLDSSDLVRILTNAGLATDTTRTIPVLGAVRLELGAGTILAVGTDRYRLHTDTAKTNGATDEAGALLDRADAAAVCKLVKGAGEVTVTISAGSFAVRTANSTATYATVDGEFPRWRSLMPEHNHDDGPSAPFAYNPQYLADFAKVVQRADYRGRAVKPSVMRIQQVSPSKPARITIGETFVALLMPVRLPDESTGCTICADTK